MGSIIYDEGINTVTVDGEAPDGIEGALAPKKLVGFTYPGMGFNTKGPMQTQKGYINESDINDNAYMLLDDYQTAQDDHPDWELWHEGWNANDPEEAERVNSDFSNAGPNDKYSLVEPARYQDEVLHGRRRIQLKRQILRPRINTGSAEEAAKILSYARGVEKAMSDWNGLLASSHYLRGFYDTATRNGSSGQTTREQERIRDNQIARDAIVLRDIFDSSGGDVRVAMQKAADDRRLTFQGYEALMSLIGHRVAIPTDKKRRPWLPKANFQRFWDAYDRINDIYDIGTAQPSSDAPVVIDRFFDPNDPYNVGNDPSKLTWDEAQRASLSAPIRTSGIETPQTFACGGQMKTRVPKHLRDEYGRKLVRVPGWGDDDTDVYF